MPWDADLEKEGHGELYVLTEDEALRLEKRGIPILTGLQTMDLEQSPLNRILLSIIIATLLTPTPFIIILTLLWPGLLSIAAIADCPLSHHHVATV